MTGKLLIKTMELQPKGRLHKKKKLLQERSNCFNILAGINKKYGAKYLIELYRKIKVW
jgi:hypothetical protein